MGIDLEDMQKTIQKLSQQDISKKWIHTYYNIPKTIIYTEEF